ncbi:histidine phosphatase family protein [Pseudomonas sp. dw_358]|uniref:lipopolysaccharide core heptose(II)-phosphate phosphatase PmrG n=1 Tax=Pseudomonas sp. dw_358 TaxID=2720083 RepID=UPI001BD35B5B|nr:histidine phosphatase family protein [Pseudomonas sp. dw_358]
MQQAGVQPRSQTAQPPRALFTRRKIILAGVILAALLAYAWVWFARPANIRDLSVGNRLAHSGLMASWKAGDIIVLLRHAERCDRSTRSCMAAENGITLHGAAVATQLGTVFSTLGLANTDVLASDTLRTQQTAQLAFKPQTATVQHWLFKCSGDVLGQALGQKTAQRNLALVTHSECFDRLERQMGITETTRNPYANALFIRVGSDGHKPRILGFMHAKNWRLASLAPAA